MPVILSSLQQVDYKKIMSNIEENIDFHALENELLSAIEDDKRYWRENDAKFRAVNQGVATYEEFR